MINGNSEQWYIVPELEVRVHQSWVNLINYCQETLPFGDIKLKMANAIPTKKLGETPKIRFDKKEPSKTTGTIYVIPSTGDRVHEYWINLIQWCQNYFQKGILEIRIIAGLPTDLLSVNQDVNFSKPETIPVGVPLKF